MHQAQEKQMKKIKKQTKPKATEKRNLSIVNQGDSIVIRNRSAIAASVIGTLVLGIAAAGLLVLRDAWNLPYFRILFGLLIVGCVYSFAKILLAKILLDSPKKLMTVYNPFPRSYKFEDVNYVDVKTEKGSDGVTLYVVTVYIGVGKRTVKLVCLSKEQAGELAILLRGMLDNGAMTYPEGCEKPFTYEKPLTHEKPSTFKKPSIFKNKEDEEFKCIMRRRDSADNQTEKENK